MKRCMHCGYSKENVLATLIDNAEVRTLCPNCFTVAVHAGELEFEADYDLVDDITGLPGAVKFVSGSETYTLAPRAMLRLLAHDLQPNEWKALVEKYGMQYMLHDDFYDEDGTAWQPVVHIPVYEWRDIVEINGKHYAECFEISGTVDKDGNPDINDFLDAVANKYCVDVNCIKTFLIDDIDLDSQCHEFDTGACGCYIDGTLESR